MKSLKPTGRRRFLMNRAQLRGEVTRLHAENEKLVRSLLKVTGENAALTIQQDALAGQVAAQGARLDEQDQLLREQARLTGDNVALRAALQNATSVRSLGATLRPSAAELTAAGRGVDQTVELETLDESVVDTTSAAWRAPVSAPVPAARGRVMTLAARFGVASVPGVPPLTAPPT